MTAPSVAIIIPARYGSTRLPAKPLIKFGGKPMIQHVYERAKRAHLAGAVIVATDDQRIFDAVRSFGGECVLTPEGARSGSDRVAMVAKQMTGTDLIVNVQGDEPLIVPRMIDEAIELLLHDPDLRAGTLIRKIENPDEAKNPSIVKVVTGPDQFAIYFSRSPIPHFRDGTDGLPAVRPAYFKHVGLYVFRRDLLLEFASWPPSKLEEIEQLEQLRMIERGIRIKTRLTNYESIPVDTAEDVDRVRTLLREQQSVQPE
jgi:3-deoxy-manno-octulosonate cytidylyltransferase (CMP-KDO synthetase)